MLTARVISQEKGLYRVLLENNEIMATVSGKLRYEAKNISDFPAVGDYVVMDSNIQGNNGVIQEVMPRKSVFIRKATGTAHVEQIVAANIDVIFICMALNNDFNLRRLERYLSIGWDSGAIPVVVLTKADLCDNISEKLAEVHSVAMGAEILITSSLEENGCNDILPYIKEGQTIALIGSSGVGKSTLINCLLGENRISTNSLRNDDKGRHTTTRRELFVLPNGAFIIDTPGMRELGMWDAAVGLDKTFTDIIDLSKSCRFRNCSHVKEPGCAIIRAIESGELTEERWQSYLKLRTENEYAADSESYIAAKEKKFKNISIMNKNNKNIKF